MTDPQSVVTTYGYDTLNRLSSLTYNGQTPNYTFGYDALSRRRVAQALISLASPTKWVPRPSRCLRRAGTTSVCS
jgi:uncharacterized protein RhaS with RHS repeats